MLDTPYVLRENWEVAQPRMSARSGISWPLHGFPIWPSTWPQMTRWELKTTTLEWQGTLSKGSWQLCRDKGPWKTAHAPFPLMGPSLWLWATLPWSMCIFTTSARPDLFLTLCFRVSSACQTRTQNEFCYQPHTLESPSFNFKRNPFSLKGKMSLFVCCLFFVWQMQHANISVLLCLDEGGLAKTSTNFRIEK